MHLAREGVLGNSCYIRAHAFTSAWYVLMRMTPTSNSTLHSPSSAQSHRSAVHVREPFVLPAAWVREGHFARAQERDTLTLPQCDRSAQHALRASTYGPMSWASGERINQLTTCTGIACLLTSMRCKAVTTTALAAPNIVGIDCWYPLSKNS